MMQDTVATQRCPRNETSSCFRTLLFKMKVAKDLMYKVLEINTYN